MDLQSRTITFIQEFLKIQSEEMVLQFERLLKGKQDTSQTSFKPMTIQELNNRIDQSEDDFAKARFKSQEEIVAKYAK